jgi:hypothetical protein
MAGTRSRGRTDNPIRDRVKGLVGLNDQECTTLITNGTTTLEELSFLNFNDLDVTIAVTKRRKLELVAKYLEATQKKKSCLLFANRHKYFGHSTTFERCNEEDSRSYCDER